MTTVITSRANINALVVDDDTVSQKLINSALKSLGVRRIEMASEGLTALHAVKLRKQANESFNLIICDWVKPVMEGISFLESFREKDQNAVVIMFTDRASATDFNEAKKKAQTIIL